jgi:hypothetical protein
MGMLVYSNQCEMIETRHVDGFRVVEIKEKSRFYSTSGGGKKWPSMIA